MQSVEILTNVRQEGRKQFDEGKFMFNEHSKLCFQAHEINFRALKQLATRLTAREGFPPKSEIRAGLSVTKKCIEPYEKREPTTKKSRAKT